MDILEIAEKVIKMEAEPDCFAVGALKIIKKRKWMNCLLSMNRWNRLDYLTREIF